MRWRPGRRGLSRQLFDATYYRRTQAIDLDAGADAYDHYVREGWARGLDPAPWFSTEDYLSDHPDVASAGMCPFEHYVRHGRQEQRHIRPSAGTDDSAPAVGAAVPAPNDGRGNGQPGRRRDPDRLARDLVDEPFYLRRYPDVAEAGVHAGDHFMEFGWHEGRDPNPWFSCAAYLAANPVVRDEHVNPFLHWVASGGTESRPVLHLSAGPSTRTQGVRTVDFFPAQRPMRRPVAYSYGIDDALHELSPEAIHDGPLVISVGNHDYLSNTGGIEACLTYEAMRLHADGNNYLYLHPLLRLPSLNDASDTSVRPILNGVPMLPISTDQISALVDGLCTLGAGRPDRMVVHGLLGHNPAALRDQAKSMGLQVDYWIHDYFAACPSYTLMRNNVSFCGAPPMQSRSCRLCVHGDLRPSHVREVHSFLELADVTLVAPSELAARTWRETTGLSDVKVEILPHGRVREAPTTPRPKPMDVRPTLAFLGFPAFHKGWDVFLRLHPWTLSRQGLRLVHLGSHDQQLLDVEFVEVRAGTDLDMTEALLANGVDAVLIWPLWPETFSLVTYEALAAGLLVVTNRESGNVGVAAAAANRAIFFDSARALERSVISGQLPRLIRQQSRSRPRPGRFEWTGLTPARLARTAP